MKFRIKVNGKIDFINISKEKATKLGLIKSNLTGYERARSGETYYVVSSNGVMNLTEDSHYDDTVLFDSGNYFTSEEIAQCVNRATTLHNQSFQAGFQLFQTLSILTPVLSENAQPTDMCMTMGQSVS